MFYFQTRYSNKLNRKFWWLYPNLTSLVHQNKQVYFVKILKTQLHPSSGILETGIEYDCKFCDLVTHGALRSSHELVEKCPCVPDRIGINLKVLVLKERGKTEYPKKKPLEARERTNHNFYPHMASTQGLESGPQGWKLRRVPSPTRHPSSYLIHDWGCAQQFYPEKWTICKIILCFDWLKRNAVSYLYVTAYTCKIWHLCSPNQKL